MFSCKNITVFLKVSIRTQKRKLANNFMFSMQCLFNMTIKMTSQSKPNVYMSAAAM